MSSRWASFNPSTFRKAEFASDCKILTDYAKGLYRENEISRELYGKFLSYIVPLCIEQMIEDKLSEVIPKWNKRFDSWFYPNLEESS
jgi:hypothetical protein